MVAPVLKGKYIIGVTAMPGAPAPCLGHHFCAWGTVLCLGYQFHATVIQEVSEVEGPHKDSITHLGPNQTESTVYAACSH